MVQYFPPPDCRSLLPPLLACLPTAFLSAQPPPALLPLLAPILRQRLQLLTATASSSSDTWLPLLCWETEPAQRLVDIVSDSDAFELHPVSGEIDYGDLEEIQYRRLDEETLQAKVVISDFKIVVIYLWCEGDQENPTSGWRVLELRPLDGDGNEPIKSWSSTISEADVKAEEKMMDEALQQGEDHSVAHQSTNGLPLTDGPQEDGDDDYWAQYDKTPGGRTPAPEPSSSPNVNRHTRSTSEAEYFARYAQVQPEMDNDDPSEDRGAIGQSTLNGNTLPSSIQEATKGSESQTHDAIALPNGSGIEAADGVIIQPTARSPTVSKLEESAETQSITESAITHHVSTSMKSLYRLCRSSGIERAEFERIIHTELETLSMVDEYD